MRKMPIWLCEQPRHRSSAQSDQHFTCLSLVFQDSYYCNDPKFLDYRSGQTAEEQSDQGLHCLLFQLHHFDKIH